MTRISTVHPGATLRPSKLALLQQWLPAQPWFRGSVADVEIVGKFRFEDPAGEVGLDNMILRSRGDLYYVPVTWRSRPLPSWAQLIGELHHSELGARYCTNAADDPVFRDELARVVIEGDGAAEIHSTTGDVVPTGVTVRGNGETPAGSLRVVRRLGTFYPGKAKLVAEWELDGVARTDVLAAG